MRTSVPSGLEKCALAFGAEGTRWLNSLPERVAQLERAWGFRTGPAFDHGGAASWVAPVELRDGSQAVLKIGIPHEEARFEAQALRFLGGRAAVRLLHVSEDGFSLLLERCLPGRDLWSLGQDDGDAVACGILPRLWRNPEPNAPFASLADAVAGWGQERPPGPAAAGYDAELVTLAVARGRELAASQREHVFLHGDFHPGNVLAAQRDPWLAIDPKPIIGEPAYDLAQWLYNRCGAALQSDDPVLALRQQIGRFAADLSLDPSRIAGWAFAKALGWDWGPEILVLFHEVAGAW